MCLTATNHNREPGEKKFKEGTIDNLLNSRTSGERLPDDKIVENFVAAADTLESVLNDFFGTLDTVDYNRAAAMHESIEVDAYLLSQLIKAAELFATG